MKSGARIAARSRYRANFAALLFIYLFCQNLFLGDVKLRSRFSGLLCIGEFLGLWNIMEDFVKTN